ncbi:hypothetical protein BC939DRAFT_182491 [Gamsiella multidivaricata]|uniref:uncharacterized protein n=1 Tax=Gamsiella multidivaricata TaxID=101098 RepID=UPI0022201569|nr:uncharacterized protein BC939DRAFT_182491 [Gamsiella multidivaricata]KAG0351082.1 hypothetical protein BGZ54_003424 [Gamsiella multidivaricata]KAI7822364.1 hypothetical protein BC939DRAFT_182491 [Gamsiella multidivaricata]
MATRLLRLLPVLKQAEEKLSASTAKEDKKYLAMLRGALITDEEVGILKEVLDILDPVVFFTNQVSREKTSTISQIYPSIFDMVNKPREPLTIDATALQASLVEQLQRRWPMDNIPHVALVSTLLNPAVASHNMFSRSGPGTLLDSAKEQVFTAFVRMAENSCLLRDNPRAEQYGLNVEDFHEDIRNNLDRYLSDVSRSKIECAEYFDRPEDWWAKRVLGSLS